MSASIVVISGTGTAVGKTHVGARLIELLRAQGVEVSARKPVQSFDPDEGPTDADRLGAAACEPASSICPPHRSIGLPLAPPIAAPMLGLPPFTVADLAAETTVPERGILLVEGVGGPRSPLAEDGDTVDLARLLRADLVLLVAGAELGAINAVVLGVAAFEGVPVVVFLNRYDPGRLVHRTNREWLTLRLGLEVVTDLDSLAARVAAAQPAWSAP
ncbi:MAG: ATP-dependent dethiobiotin synthetase BioD [Actinomycetota bacterium]